MFKECTGFQLYPLCLLVIGLEDGNKKEDVNLGSLSMVGFDNRAVGMG